MCILRFKALGIKYLNPNLCTHLIYGFLNDFKEDLSKQTNKILSMKKVNTKLKVMASIQGYNKFPSHLLQCKAKIT